MYLGIILLMSRILSSIFYINGMRKTSEEFNLEVMVRNIWMLCEEESVVGSCPIGKPSTGIWNGWIRITYRKPFIVCAASC